MDQNNQDVDQKRFIAAMVLSGLVLVIWQMFFAPEPPPPEPGETAAGVTEQVDQDAQPAPRVADETSTPTPTEQPPIEAPKDLPVVEHVVRTDNFQVTLSSRGARVKGADILEPEQYQAQGNLLGEFPDDSKFFPFALTFAGETITIPRNAVYAVVPEESEKAGETWSKVVYRYVDPAGRFHVDKAYGINRDAPFELELKVSVVNHQSQRITDKLAIDIFGYKDPEKSSSFLDMRPDEVEGICKLVDDLEREMINSVDSPLTFSESPVLWGAIDTRYFIFAAVPANQAEKCTMEVVDENYLRTRVIQDEFSIGANEVYTESYQIFVGPKDYDILSSAGQGLEEAVDYGLLTFLARPLRWCLVLFNGWVHNWGLAIIILTFFIRLLLWPINQKVYVNSERMKEVQPRIQEIREKYKDDQQKLAEETMKVFRENKVSPMGCLPMFLQFPILLALYYMILNSVELYQASFALWYTDLSAPDPYFVLPVLMGGIMYVQQSFMTVETPNPQMKTVMRIMPITMTALFLFLPAGVVLYYFVSLLLGLLQQWIIKRRFSKSEAAAA